MGKLIVSNIISLDGCFEGPGRNVMMLPMDGAFDAYNLERMKAAGTVLLGHNSYKLFSSFWPGMADNPDASPTNKEFSTLYNKIDKVIVSNKLHEDEVVAPWKGTTRIIGGSDIYADITKLKQSSNKDIVMYASHLLWNDLMEHGIVDELHFIVGNVVLGDGTPAFVKSIAYDDPSRSLELLDTRQFEGSQNYLAKYKVAYKD